MQAVILAAGRGTRMKELTADVPKPLLQVNGVSLLHRKLAELPNTVDEVIFIIGYQGDKIREAFGPAYEGRRIRYIEQDALDGTAGALWRARGALVGRFLVMMGDDLYAREDLSAVAESPDWAVLVNPTACMGSGGSVVVDQGGVVTGIEEGDHRGKPGIMNTNLFALDTRVFDHPMIPASNGKQEFGLPQTVVAASIASGIPLHACNAGFWFQITAPEDLQRAGEVVGARGR